MKKKFFYTLFLFLCFIAYAQKTNIPNVYKYTLKNGLELFIAENDSAPLVYIEIAVRAGAVTQTPKTAGLFHLYEHMMFKGNSKFKNQKEVTEELNKLGVSDWNGTTGVDRVNYYFTIPSSMLEKGLEFWSYAIRTPLLDTKELENEKNVVLSEIIGNQSDSSRIFSSGLFKNLFSESPWKLDSGGNPENIKNCTVQQLKEIQQKFYVPNNSALFVGGDVQHEEVYKLVNKIYGDWKLNINDLTEEQVNNFSDKITDKKEDIKLVYSDPRNSGNIIQFAYYLQGPNGQTDENDTYAADVWSYLVDNPNGNFLKDILKEKSFEIPDEDYVGAFYSTQRLSGIIGFSAAMLNTSQLPVWEKTDNFLTFIKTKSIPNMLNSDSGFENKNIVSVKNKIEDSRIYSLETAEGFLSGLSYAWSSCNSDYFFHYDENILKVDSEDIKEFVKKYLVNKSGVCVVSVNPEYYKKNKTEFDSAGWEELNSSNAFWWMKK